MATEQERKEHTRRQAERWFNSLSVVEQCELENMRLAPFEDEVNQRLAMEGYINGKGELTAAGELRLHQLKLLEWMATHPRKTGVTCDDTATTAPVEDDAPSRASRRNQSGNGLD